MFDLRGSFIVLPIRSDVCVEPLLNERILHRNYEGSRCKFSSIRVALSSTFYTHPRYQLCLSINHLMYLSYSAMKYCKALLAGTFQSRDALKLKWNKLRKVIWTYMSSRNQSLLVSSHLWFCDVSDRWSYPVLVCLVKRFVGCVQCLW